LQGLIYCGECERAISVCQRKYYYYYYNGERRERKTVNYGYHCPFAALYSEEPHPRPYNFGGKELDWAVWRYIVDHGIEHPELIYEQTQARQRELQSQGESLTGEIARAHRKLSEVDEERAFYQRQAARGKITEQEFDLRMTETEDVREHWKEQISHLLELRDGADRIQASLHYATRLLTAIQKRLPIIDLAPAGLKALPAEQQREILEERRTIVRALCTKVTIDANRHVVIEGMIDGSEAGHFDLPSPRTGQRSPGSGPPRRGDPW
jgi:hypothetical protein